MVNLFSMKDYTKSTGTKAYKAFTSLLISLLIISISLGAFGVQPTQAQATTYPEYVVQAGDSLLWIASKFNTTLEAIMQVNQIGPDSTLHPGDKIKIPSLAGLEGVLSSEYVGLGTSINSLSRRSQVELGKLIRLNRITSPSELFIGREIFLTDVDQETPSTASAILEGQTFLELAIKSGQNQWALSHRNLLTNPNFALPQDSYYVPSANTQSDTLAVPGIGSVSIDNLPLRQGETYVLHVQSPSNVEIEAELVNQSPQFTDLGEGKQIAFGGINALTEPGVYPLTMTFRRDNGYVYRFDQLIVVKSGHYPEETLLVDPATMDEENIRAENAIFYEIIKPITPVQYWDGVFTSPAQDIDCITSKFGTRRTYNNDPNIYYHTGLDFGFCKGIDVYAPAAGKVVGVLPDLIIRGNTIVIDHGLGIYSIYMHLEKMMVEEGTMVQPGQLIGLIGTTGRSTGPHLHFEINAQGVPVSPATWLKRVFP